jgi:hypothetical protein
VRIEQLLFHLFGVSEPAFALGLPNGWLPAPASEARIDEEQRRARERHTYRRVQAPLLCRPAGLRLFAPHESGVTRDVGRIRIYSDERFALGDRLKLKILARGAASKKFFAEVAWLEAMREGPTRYDVGLHVERIDDATATLLRSVLRP